MKKTMKFGVLFAMSFTALNTFATIRTVSNNVNSPGQYTDLQAAITAAANNDTIYIHRSDVDYGNITINKTLTLIGEGALPNKQVQLTPSSSVQIQSINLTFAAFPATTTASGSKFYGLNVQSVTIGHISSTGQYNTVAISNLTFNRNRIGYLYLNAIHSNILFFQNSVYGVYQTSGGGAFVNSVISNNIITRFEAVTTLGSNTVISNNIFQNYFSARGAVVSNNIFYNSASSGAINISTYSCTISNNLFYAFTPVIGTNIISGTNTGTGNLFNVDPQFTTAALCSDVYNYTYTAPTAGPFADFHLLSSSPGVNYGTDGTNIGLYGGNYPWIDGSTTDSRFRYYPMTSQVPQMIQMNITNPTLPVNGTLNVNFNAKTQN
jgi:hypothetical protein